MYQIILFPDLVWWLVTAVLGLIAGSFLNVVIYRLPLILKHRWQAEARAFLAESEDLQMTSNLSLAYPPSHCVQCATPILWHHKIPLLSFILLRGKCAYCSKSIGIHYPMIEALTVITWLTVFAIYGISYATIFGVLFVSCLIALAGIDQKEGYLIDEITMPLLWAGLLANCFNVIVSAPQAILGAALGYTSFFMLNHLFKMVRKRHGLGPGDMKLLAAVGACLGWEVLPAIVLIASLSGLLFYSLSYLKKSYTLSDAIPFGPHLAIGGILCFLFYPQLSIPFGFIYTL